MFRDNVNLVVEPLSPFGAEVRSLDLRRELGEGVKSALRDAWRGYGLLLFRDQELAKSDQLRVLRIFGEVTEQGTAPGGFNFITNIAQRGLAEDGEMNLYSVGELQFHFDHPYYQTPLRGIMLYAIEVPPPERGGDTLFSDARIAYRLLPEALRDRIASLRVRYAPARDTDPTRGSAAEHPLLLVHPQTGAKILFLSRRHAAGIAGLSPEESTPLLDELATYIERPEAIYRHVWRPKDLVVWDNLALQHARTDYDATSRRHLRKAQIGAPV